MKRRAVIGIDNGLKGGLCALCPESGDVIDYAVMPTRSQFSTDEADPAGVLAWVGSFDCVLVGIEEPLKFAPTSQAIRSMALSFGLCCGALEAANFPVARVCVSDWQKKMIGKFPAGQSKPYALAAARRLWPSESWLPSKRHRAPHDGIVDGALLARYLRDNFAIK